MSRVVVELLDRKQLSKAESRVLLPLCLGKLRQEIADELCRSYGTVSKHIETIAEKLDAHSAAEIVSKAVAHGIVSITLKVFLLAVMVGMTQYQHDGALQRTVRVSRTVIYRYLREVA